MKKENIVRNYLTNKFLLCKLLDVRKYSLVLKGSSVSGATMLLSELNNHSGIVATIHEFASSTSTFHFTAFQFGKLQLNVGTLVDEVQQSNPQATLVAREGGKMDSSSEIERKELIEAIKIRIFFEELALGFISVGDYSRCFLNQYQKDYPCGVCVSVEYLAKNVLLSVYLSDTTDSEDLSSGELKSTFSPLHVPCVDTPLEKMQFTALDGVKTDWGSILKGRCKVSSIPDDEWCNIRIGKDSLRKITKDIRFSGILDILFEENMRIEIIIPRAFLLNRKTKIEPESESSLTRERLFISHHIAQKKSTEGSKKPLSSVKKKVISRRSPRYNKGDDDHRDVENPPTKDRDSGRWGVSLLKDMVSGTVSGVPNEIRTGYNSTTTSTSIYDPYKRRGESARKRKYEPQERHGKYYISPTGPVSWKLTKRLKEKSIAFSGNEVCSESTNHPESAHATILIYILSFCCGRGPNEEFHKFDGAKWSDHEFLHRLKFAIGGNLANLEPSHQNIITETGWYPDLMLTLAEYWKSVRLLTGGEGSLMNVERYLSTTGALHRSSLFHLKPPSFTTRFDSGFINTSPTSISFWEKARLKPFSEKKNLVFYAVAPKLKESYLMESFFFNLECVYETCQLGEHIPAENCFRFVDISNDIDGNRSQGSGEDVLLKYSEALVELFADIAKQENVKEKKRQSSNENLVIYILTPFAKSVERILFTLISTHLLEFSRLCCIMVPLSCILESTQQACSLSIMKEICFTAYQRSMDVQVIETSASELKMLLYEPLYVLSVEVGSVHATYNHSAVVISDNTGRILCGWPLSGSNDSEKVKICFSKILIVCNWFSKKLSTAENEQKDVGVSLVVAKENSYSDEELGAWRTELAKGSRKILRDVSIVKIGHTTELVICNSHISNVNGGSDGNRGIKSEIHREYVPFAVSNSKDSFVLVMGGGTSKSSQSSRKLLCYIVNQMHYTAHAAAPPSEVISPSRPEVLKLEFILTRYFTTSSVKDSIHRVCAELHGLSWLTVSPTSPERKSAMPLHLSLLKRVSGQYTGSS